MPRRLGIFSVELQRQWHEIFIAESSSYFCVDSLTWCVFFLKNFMLNALLFKDLSVRQMIVCYLTHYVKDSVYLVFSKITTFSLQQPVKKGKQQQAPVSKVCFTLALKI